MSVSPVWPGTVPWPCCSDRGRVEESPGTRQGAPHRRWRLHFALRDLLRSLPMSLFLTIAAVQLIALMSPGPDFFYVSQTAVSHSRREALAGVVGIALGVAVWAAFALLGLQLLLHRLAWLERAIAVCGGVYLCWMGLKMLRDALTSPAGDTTVRVVRLVNGP